MSLRDSIVQNKIKLIAVFACLIIGMTAVVWAWFEFGQDMGALIALTQDWISRLREAHWIYLWLAIALLPIVSFPASPLVILAGNYGAVNGVLLATSALAVNLTLAYFLAGYVFRAVVERLMRRMGYAIPVVPKAQEWRFILLFRMIPGLPLVVQNNVLGLAKVSFPIYLAISAGVQFFWIVGFVVLGEGIMKGQAGTVIIGAFFIVVLVLFTRFLKKRKGAPDEQSTASH